MAGSDYSLRLRATLDTTQVQQELKKLRSAQAMVLDPGGSGTNKGLQGVSHMQKIEVQLTKLNSSIAGLQRAIEQLTRTQFNTGHQSKVLPGKLNSPYLPNGMTQKQFGSWLDSSEYKKLNNKVADLFKRYGFATGRKANYGGETFNLNDPYLAHRVMGTGLMKGLDPSLNKSNYKDLMSNWNMMNDPKSQKQQFAQGRQIASYIGGQMLGGAGELATGLGYKKTGAVLGGIGEGVTAGGSMAFTASLMGAGAAVAGPIGIIVGLGTAALAVTKSLNEMNEASKQAAENQRKVAEALLQTSIAQSTERYGTWQGIRAQQALNENNLPVAKERAAYFKKELNKS